MSKELEALKLLEIEYNKLGYTIDIDSVDVIDLLRRSLTPPTADEVCKALSEYLDKNVEYFNIFGFVCDEKVIICLFPNNILSFNDNYPPHIYSIVGRFYEGLEKDINHGHKG